MELYGFAMIRNGVKFDYPFLESLRSLHSLTKEIHIAVGKSEEGTEEALDSLEFSSQLIQIPTIWDDSRTDRGHIFSEQTNIALNSLRNNLKDNENYDKAFGIYLQSDEVFHEDDYETIRSDMKKALDGGYDAVSFRYFHFWQNHNEIAINKKWYPQEIRAVKLNSSIESYGDAQSFANCKKVFYSNAFIYHYGHVRDKKAYQDKMDRMIRYYHPTDGFKRYYKKWHRKDKYTETIPFFGDHPKVMKERMERIGGTFVKPEVETVYIKASPSDFSQQLLKKIHAQNVVFVKTLKDVPQKLRKFTIIKRPNLLERFFHPSFVPEKMRSKLSLPWTNDTVLMLKLSERGIGLKKIS